MASGSATPATHHGGEDPADALEDGVLQEVAEHGELEDDGVEAGLAARVSGAWP